MLWRGVLSALSSFRGRAYCHCRYLTFDMRLPSSIQKCAGLEQCAAGKSCDRSDGSCPIECHVRAMHYQLIIVRQALAMALQLDRVLVLPDSLQCFCDRTVSTCACVNRVR